MTRSARYILVSALLFFTAQAHCFFHFEPGIGYNRGHLQASKSQGIGLTTKLGVEFDSFFILADIGYHDLQIASIPTSTATDAGLCLGGDFSSWRFWFTYIASANVKTGSGTASTTYGGGGIKLGLSGKISKNAYMNLEYRSIDINDVNGTPSSQLMDMALLSVSWKLF